MPIKCRTNQQAQQQADHGRKKRSWSEAERSELRKRAQQQNKLLDALREVHGDPAKEQAAAVSAKVEGYQREWQALNAELINLNPSEADRLQSYLAKNFGMIRSAFGLGDNLTTAGSVRVGLNDARRFAEGLVDVVGKYTTIGKMRDLRKELIQIGKRHNVKGRELDELFVEVVEAGQTPRTRLALGNSEAVNAWLDRRVERFNKLMKATGFSDEEVDRLVELSMQASNVFDEVRMTAQALGVHIDPINNIGYWARQLTDDAKLRLDLLWQKDGGYAKPGIGTSKHARERSTWWLIPEDYVVLSEFFTPGATKNWNKWLREATGLEQSGLDNLGKVLAKERKTKLITSQDIDEELARLVSLKTKDPTFTVADLYDKRAELVREAGGRSEAEWDALFQDPIKFLDELHNNLTAEQVDTLVDAGVLSKVPMTSREVFDYFVKQYQLPYTRMSDMFKTDVGQALQGYRESLRKAAGDSAIFKRIVDDGHRAGWIATPLEVAANPSEFKNFKRLSELDMTRFGTDEVLAEQFRGAYVHPLVHEQLEGLINLSVSPKGMHEFASTVHWFLRNIQTSALLGSNVGYVAKQVLSNTINYVAGGGHLQRIIPTAIDLIKLFRGGLDALDNTAQFRMDGGKWLTKREWYRQAMMSRGQDVVPLSAGHRIGDTYGSLGILNPANLPKAAYDVVSYAQMFGDPINGVKGALGYTGKKLERLLNTGLAPFASAATFVDLTYKFSLAQSVMKGNGFDDAVRQAHSFVSANHSKSTLREAFEHVDNYYIDYTNLGKAQLNFGRYVRPFASYALMNPPMQLRHAMRNPSAFMAYMRMSSILYGAGVRPEITEAGFSKNELDDTPAAIMYDPDSKLATVLFSANYDPIIDAYTFAKETGEKFARVTGNFAGSGWEQREDLTQKYTVRQLMEDLLGKDSNPAWKTVSEIISGRDSFTGQELDKSKRDLFGVQMPSDVVWLLSKFPLIGALDRATGGRGYIEDQFGRRVAEAEPGLLGTPNRKATRTEASDYYTEQRLSGFANNVRKLVGLRVRTIDLAEGNQYTYKDIMKARNELKKVIMAKSKSVREANRTQDPKAIQELETLRAQYIQLTVDAYRVRDWAQRNKVDIDGAFKKLQEQQQAIRGLPVPSALMERLIQDSSQELRKDYANE
ncbi:tail fiber protein [Leptolyngbya phage LPP-2, strain SPI]|uniref:Tail fiber protein n=1 Tax=Leptolyngbya phage LPP-2, strain SPI TaxID=2996053 RepID=A0A9Y1GRQ9_9CAUD|nr:tail fiber protein [Leptolyngbya phage LPP-2 st. SPI]